MWISRQVLGRIDCKDFLSKCWQRRLSMRSIPVMKEEPGLLCSSQQLTTNPTEAGAVRSSTKNWVLIVEEGQLIVDNEVGEM
jgi:hypothetical protein